MVMNFNDRIDLPQFIRWNVTLQCLYDFNQLGTFDISQPFLVIQFWFHPFQGLWKIIKKWTHYWPIILWEFSNRIFLLLRFSMKLILLIDYLSISNLYYQIIYNLYVPLGLLMTKEGISLSLIRKVIGWNLEEYYQPKYGINFKKQRFNASSWVNPNAFRP